MLLCFMNQNTTDTKGILRIALEYALSNAEEQKMDEILSAELDREEKMSLLLNLREEQIRSVLLRMGFKQEFLNTI